MRGIGLGWRTAVYGLKIIMRHTKKRGPFLQGPLFFINSQKSYFTSGITSTGSSSLTSLCSFLCLFLQHGLCSFLQHSFLQWCSGQHFSLFTQHFSRLWCSLGSQHVRFFLQQQAGAIKIRPAMHSIARSFFIAFSSLEVDTISRTLS